MQVLPSELLLLAEPSPAALAAELERALTLLHTVDAERQHRQAYHGLEQSHPVSTNAACPFQGRRSSVVGIAMAGSS